MMRSVPILKSELARPVKPSSVIQQQTRSQSEFSSSVGCRLGVIEVHKQRMTSVTSRIVGMSLTMHGVPQAMASITQRPKVLPGWRDKRQRRADIAARASSRQSNPGT